MAQVFFIYLTPEHSWWISASLWFLYSTAQHLVMLYISLLYGVIYIEGRVETNLMNIHLIMIFISYSTQHVILYISLLYGVIYVALGLSNCIKDSGYTNILQDKTLFCAFEADDIVCWLANPPIAKLDLFKTADCRWICKTYVEYCYRNSAIVCRLVQSPT